MLELVDSPNGTLSDLKDRVRSKWGEWIPELAPWNVFYTVTFRALTPYQHEQGYTRRGVALANNRVFTTVSTLGRFVGEYAVFNVTELHASKQPHCHGLAAIEPSHLEIFLKYSKIALTTAFGWSRVEELDPEGGGVAYIAKYLNKSKDTDFKVGGSLMDDVAYMIPKSL